jgi:8-oxo-dGTP diphosphatase
MTYWGQRGAGIAFICPADSTILLVKRSPYVNEPGTWGIPGGRVEPGEHPFDAAMREVAEELGSVPQGILQHASVYRDNSFEYTTYFVVVHPVGKARWTPTIVLDWENTDARWFAADRLPRPLHFGVAQLRDVIEQIAGI